MNSVGLRTMKSCCISGGGSPIRCNIVVQYARCGLPHSRLPRRKRAGVLLILLSLGRRRTTRACDARAPRRDKFDRLTRNEKPLHHREASPICCNTVMRCARCGLPHSRLSRGKRAGVPLILLSLGRRRTTRACDARAPRRNGCGRSIRHQKQPHQRGRSPIRCSTVVRCARCALRSWPSRVKRSASHCAGYLLGGGAKRALTTRARITAIIVVGPNAM